MLTSYAPVARGKSIFNMEPFKANNVCNYIGGDDAEYAAQSDELSEVGISIQPNGGNNYCWYKAGDEFIKPFESSDGYAARQGDIYPDSRYIYFNRSAPTSIPDKFRQYESSASNVEIAEFMALEAKDAGYLGNDDDLLSVRETLLKYIKEKWPKAEIIDDDLRLAGEVSKRRKWTIYIAGFNLPKTGEDILNQARLPKFTTKQCPEWVLHKERVSGELRVEGWELVRQDGGSYLAIPREGLKTEIKGRLGRTEIYAQDLRTKLGFSEYLKGDNPTRLLRDVEFVGAGGVVGLECPVFKVDIVDTPKRVERAPNVQPQDIEMPEYGKRAVEFLKRGAEGLQDIYTEYRVRRAGYEWSREQKELRKKEEARRIFELQEKEFRKQEMLDVLKPDAEKAKIYSYYDYEERADVFKELARSTGGGDPRCVNCCNREKLIPEFEAALKLPHRVDSYQIVFLIEASDDMEGSISEIEWNSDEILEIARRQVSFDGRVEVGLKGFAGRMLLTWQLLSRLEKGSASFKEALRYLRNNSGFDRPEPVWDVIVKTMKEEKWREGSSKKMVIVIGTATAILDNGYDREKVYEMAKKMGIVVEIIMMAR